MTFILRESNAPSQLAYSYTYRLTRLFFLGITLCIYINILLNRINKWNIRNCKNLNIQSDLYSLSGYPRNFEKWPPVIEVGHSIEAEYKINI